jgi:hypothetical protein
MTTAPEPLSLQINVQYFTTLKTIAALNQAWLSKKVFFFIAALCWPVSFSTQWP